jgi:hypothetical protein
LIPIMSAGASRRSGIEARRSSLRRFDCFPRTTKLALMNCFNYTT